MFLEVMEELDSQVSSMLSHHSRVLFLRLDVRCYEFSSTNKVMSDFMRLLKRRLIARYGFTRVGYLWVREVSKAKKQHYHLVLLLDGNKVQHPKKVIEIAEDVGFDLYLPKIYTPKNCFLKLDRHDKSQLARAIYRGSYLAKTRTKTRFKHVKARSYGSSNIRPRNEVIQ